MKTVAAIVFCFLLSAAYASEHGPNVLLLTNDDFEEKTGDGKVHFIKFFAPWCGHCKRLAPTWTELADGFVGNDQISIASVDCTKHNEVCSKAEIKGYPTLKTYFNGKEIESYKGPRALTQLKEFVEGQAKTLLGETTA